MKKYLKFLHIYFNTNIILIEDSTNNGTCYLMNYLNSLSLLRLYQRHEFQPTKTSIHSYVAKQE